MPSDLNTRFDKYLLLFLLLLKLKLLIELSKAIFKESFSKLIREILDHIFTNLILLYKLISFIGIVVAGFIGLNNAYFNFFYLFSDVKNILIDFLYVDLRWKFDNINILDDFFSLNFELILNFLQMQILSIRTHNHIVLIGSLAQLFVFFCDLSILL